MSALSVDRFPGGWKTAQDKTLVLYLDLEIVLRRLTLVNPLKEYHLMARLGS